MTGLSLDQKRILAQRARAAYLAWGGREHFEAVNSDLTKTACFEAWRHVETGKAVGIQSFRELTQAHFKRVEAHFLGLAGETQRAQYALDRDQDNARRQAMWKLTAMLRDRGLGHDYAATICRSKYRCTLDAATTKQVWSLFYDVRKRPAKCAQLVAADNDGPDCPF